jgi:RNA polymerase sigma factor (sigma-70 family)
MSVTEVTTLNSKGSGACVCDPRMMNDECLVATAKSGDRAAFDELCERHAQKMFRISHRITRNREDAEDAVQECFLNAFIHLKSFNGRSRFSTWLTRIAMNAALMKLRKNRVCREVPTEEPVETSEFRHRLADPLPNPEERYAKSEREAILRDSVAKLRPGIQKVVEIQLQDRSLDEIAELLGISVHAVKARLFHARAALRKRSQLHLVVPSIGTNSESSSHAVGQGFRPRQGRKQTERAYIAPEAGIQARGFSFEEAQL